MLKFKRNNVKGSKVMNIIPFIFLNSWISKFITRSFIELLLNAYRPIGKGNKTDKLLNQPVKYPQVVKVHCYLSFLFQFQICGHLKGYFAWKIKKFSLSVTQNLKHINIVSYITLRYFNFLINQLLLLSVDVAIIN